MKRDAIFFTILVCWLACFGPMIHAGQVILVDEEFYTLDQWETFHFPNISQE